MKSSNTVGTEKLKEVNPKERIVIPEPNFITAEFFIENLPNSPFCQLRFSQKAKNAMHEKHEAGSTASKGKKREARDFQSEFPAAMYESTEGWRGIPAAAFRNAMISACRVVGFKMTVAKLTVFAEADGFDKLDATPLVRITEGEPEYFESMVRNASGVADIRVRALWRKWKAKLRVRFDADQFKLIDVTNLLARAGLQVGVGEGRPDGKESAGMGFGMFKVTA